MKLLLSLVAIFGWSLTQLDISNAFLNGDLDEEIYMKLPLGYSSKQGDLPPNAVCKLEKSRYGLKQASRQWFLKFQSTLLSLGFTHLHSDHTCFLKHTEGAFLCILVYVDDIIIASNNDSAVDALKLQLHSHFKLRDLGPLKYFLALRLLEVLKVSLFPSENMLSISWMKLVYLDASLHQFLLILISNFLLKLVVSWLILKPIVV